jgi:hypothetical protein
MENLKRSHAGVPVMAELMCRGWMASASVLDEKEEEPAREGGGVTLLCPDEEAEARDANGRGSPARLISCFALTSFLVCHSSSVNRTATLFWYDTFRTRMVPVRTSGCGCAAVRWVVAGIDKIR